MKVGRSTVDVKRDSGCGRVEKYDRNAIVHHNPHKHCHTSERTLRTAGGSPPRPARSSAPRPPPRPIGHRHAATSMHCTCNITQQITDDDHQLPASARSATQPAPQITDRAALAASPPARALTAALRRVATTPPLWPLALLGCAACAHAPRRRGRGGQPRRAPLRCLHEGDQSRAPPTAWQRGRAEHRQSLLRR